jgi:exocyst complex component 4
MYAKLTDIPFSEFDAVVTSFKTLSTTVLKTLHLTFRTQIIYSLSTSFKTNYTLDSILNEPDPAIISLNNMLVNFDIEVSTYIPASQYALITRGMGSLMDVYLLSLCRGITAMNAYGCALMQLNILVLQQNLKNIESDAELPYSGLYFDLFTAGPDEIVRRAKKHGKGFGVNGPAGELFGYDTVKGLIELWYAEKLRDERRDVNVQAKRQLDAQLLEISEFMY